MKKKNKNKLRKRRHGFFYRLLRPLIIIFLKIKFGYKFKTAKRLKENYIVLSNHNTDYDPLFVASSFRKPMYFVASEHITRLGTAYKLLDYVLSPIIRYKGSVASSTVLEAFRRLRQGCNVCIFAEGIRSWDGRTCEILPSTAKFVKSSKCGLITYKIKGGYFLSPNWSEKGTRKGKISGAPVNYYSSEQLSQMTDEEIYDIIKNDLYEDAYETQALKTYKYKGKRLAENLENLIFICPKCKSHDQLHSCKDKVVCNHCGLEFKYNMFGYLEGLEQKTVYELSEWQLEEIKKDYKNKVVYSTKMATLSAVGLDHSKTLLSEGELTMTTTTIKVGDKSFKLKSLVDLNIYGRHGIVFSCDNVYYEINPSINSSAYKYVLYYKTIKNNFRKKGK